jgi:hypothetical protein
MGVVDYYFKPSVDPSFIESEECPRNMFSSAHVTGALKDILALGAKSEAIQE